MRRRWLPVLWLGLAAGARAGMEAPLPMPVSQSYLDECGGCHTAYAPGFLPARSWRALMTGLDRHFGADASLEPATREALLAELVVLAGDGRHADPGIARHNPPGHETPVRISTSAFFRYMHDEIPATVWQRGKVASKANCGACHPRADTGRYFEREIRIPKP